MSHSYRSQKESVTAERRIERDADGSPRLPRIIERAPAPGDVHPLPKRILRRLLPRIPIEFLYGLDRIELRAREAPVSDSTLLGLYLVDERAILLYSIPPVVFSRSLSTAFRRSLERVRARIESQGDGVTVSWPEPAMRSFWYYSAIFTHELGHHFVEQYKSKNSRILSRNMEELVADLHSRRITDEIFASFCAPQKSKPPG